MKQVEIERINIRLRGISPAIARSAVAGLGGHLLEGIAQSAAIRRRMGRVRLEQVDLGKSVAQRASSPSAMRARIAHAVIEAIRTEI